MSPMNAGEICKSEAPLFRADYDGLHPHITSLVTTKYVDEKPAAHTAKMKLSDATYN